MKLSNYLIGSLAFITRVFANNLVENDVPMEPVEPELVELKSFDADYIIEEFPGHTREQVVEVFNGNKITLKYNIANDEEENMTLVGIGGSFLDPLTRQPNYNLTANSIQPIVIKPHESGSIRQVVRMEVVAGNYILSPSVYVAFHDQLKEIKVRSQLVAVSDVPVSLFDPQFFFLVLILSIGFGSIGYCIYTTSLKKYLRKTAPLTKSSGSTGTGSGFDPSWIPKNHITVTKKSKSRKAY